MTRGAAYFVGLLTSLACLARAQEPALFVARPGQVVKLNDLNDDGDFLDFGEATIYAENLPANLGAIDFHTDHLFVIDAGNAAVLMLRDLNQDGDALDFGEVVSYAEIPNPNQSAAAAGLACLSDGTMLIADATDGVLYRLADLNADGDALDADETVMVGEGLTDPTAFAVQPDGVVLLAQDSTSVPVRILHDRNADGDYRDFAENISYAEEAAPGQDITAPADHVAYMTRPGEGKVIRLQDLTGDGDVLDFGEVVVFAEGLLTPMFVTKGMAGGLFVAAGDVAGTLYYLQDRNGDGDALDFGEVLVVAEGLTQPTGIVYTLPQCQKGDISGDGDVSFADVAPFIEVLLGRTSLPDPCPADMNSDGAIDGRDAQSFVLALL